MGNNNIDIEAVYDEVLLIKDAMQSGFESVDSRLSILEEEQVVEVTNGEKKEVKVSSLVVHQHDKINEIYDAVEIFVDFSKVHRIFKKWKVYWLMFLALPGYGVGWILSKIL